jgi:hypothetical protein
LKRLEFDKIIIKKFDLVDKESKLIDLTNNLDRNGNTLLQSRGIYKLVEIKEIEEGN